MSETSVDREPSPSPRRALVAVLAIVVLAGAAWSISRQLGQSRGPVVGRGWQGPVFNVSQASIPVDQIRRGGPPKDGIPSLSGAKFVAASDASFMNPDDRVIGVVVAEEAKAYPHKILNFHEAVNDRVGGQSLLVTYCPLCDSSAVFDREFEGQEYEFGISGLLYNSNVLLYDRAADGRESLWSQMAAAAVTGVNTEQPLRCLPLEVTSWSDWRQRYPKTFVLSTETGHNRQYDRRSYKDYFDSPRLAFPVDPLDERLLPKTPVLGVAAETTSRAYRLESFVGDEKIRIEDKIDGRKLTLVYDPKHESIRVENAEEGLRWVYSFWFAWSAFNPQTEIFEP